MATLSTLVQERPIPTDLREGAPTNDPGAGPSRAVLRLAALTAALGAISALVGVLWRGAGESVRTVTFLGDEVELFGRGLYANDTVFIAANNFATDLTMLVVLLPATLIALRLYARGSLRGRLLLLGVQGVFLYVAATYALGGVAFNEMFLVYVAFLSATLFAIIATFLTFRGDPVRRIASADLPRRLGGVFLIASGVATFFIWLMEPLAALLAGDTPKGLETHTTLFTHAFDLAIIVPAAVFGGWLILRREAWGWVVGFSLLVLEACLLPVMAIATFLQVRWGIGFTPAEIVGPLVGFGVLAAFAIWVIVAAVRALPVELARPRPSTPGSPG